MHLKLLSLAITAALLTGCNGDSNSQNTDLPLTPLDPSIPVKPEQPLIPLEPSIPVEPEIPEPPVEPELPEPPTEPDTIPPSVLDPAIKIHKGGLQLSGKQLVGDISCNGQELALNGQFTFKDGDDIRCDFGSIELFSQQAPQPRSLHSDAQKVIHFDIEHFLHDGAVDNTVQVLNKIDTCKSDNNKVCLDVINSYDIATLYNSTDTEAVKEFINPSSEQVTEEVDKAPSSHVDVTLKPEVTPGASTDLNSQFVSASAESAYQYKPSVDNQEITVAKLLDAKGLPIAGVHYYTPSSRGVTDSQGQIEYIWGEEITFGIDTFTFGSVKGNQLSYQLTDVTENSLVKQNIDSLIERYSKNLHDHREFDTKVHQIFALYPNAINEIINISLPNGAKIEGTNFHVPNEFEHQFDSGLAKEIDEQLKQPKSLWAEQTKIVKAHGSNINATLHQIYSGVQQFHVFHDVGSYYGASGFARLMRNLNISNTAFPILMPRMDSNYWLPFGKEQAWTREFKPHIVDATTIDADSKVTMLRPPKVSDDNATFNLPGISTGQIGKGSVVFMGSGHYPIVLSCPDSYWGNKSLSIKDQHCTYSINNNIVDPTTDRQFDNGSMQRFFKNLFTWFEPSYQNGQNAINVATNIELAPKFDHGHQSWLPKYEFFINKSYNVSLEHIASGNFSGINPETTPILLLQSYEIGAFGDGTTTKNISDLSQPKLTANDVNDLIQYINAGGHIVFFDAIEQVNPEPIAKLADMAGVSLGGANVAQAKTTQAYCGSSYYCHGSGVKPNVHTVTEHDLVVYERFETLNDDVSKIVINSDGTITWPAPNKMPKLEVAKYTTPYMPLTIDGIPQERFAFFQVKSEDEKRAAIHELQVAFPGVKVCQDDYEFEVNCIEFRKGHGIPSFGNYQRANYERYSISPKVIDSMVEAANLGTNLTKLYQHELYYRTRGEQGHRLSLTELNQTYDNTSVWMWNDEPYRYDNSVEDELGFKTAVDYLNCYTNNQHQGGIECSVDKQQALIKYGFLHKNGELNPSYPLNYQEKPLTRIMLGRSYWDLDIKVDTTQYPGRPAFTNGTQTVTVSTLNNAVTGTVNNMQSTGLWAHQHQQVQVSGGVPATITVSLIDDLTGLEQHEVALNRPPRVQKSFNYDGSNLSFRVPYGGLIYIKPHSNIEGTAEFSFSGVATAAFWKDNQWMYGKASDVPLAEIDTGHVIYTTPVENIEQQDIQIFVDEMNKFANSASDFYGRDEVVSVGKHRRFTYQDLADHRHRFVNDIQISIGAAHSGYPVQSTTYNKGNKIPTTPTNDWLLWHEIGHNLASAPFSMTGGTEVTNNILALYMQEQRPEPNNKMSRVESDIQKMPLLFSRYNKHVWSNGDAGIRLVMFAQLKLWAENHFRIDNWYSEKDLLTIYNQDQGWNMFKLMHRKSRGDSIGDQGINYCSSSDTGLSGGDLLMVCSSYVSGFDLSNFYTLWNPSESMNVLPNGDKLYSGGITSKGYQVLNQIPNLKQPETSPESITHL
ncbi:TPA: SslE/AcfD family lipoprotein zinc metalloprotease [Photobacterium damselae]